MTPESGIILSIPEIRLCMNVLGCERWDDLPLLDNGESAEQRLMNAFFHLITTGRFSSVEGGYRMEDGFHQLMLRIGQADCCWAAQENERILFFLYKKERYLTVLSPDWGNRESCRISFFADTTIPQVLECFRDPESGTGIPELLPMENEHAEKGEYDIEKLAYFLGTEGKMEEVK